MTSLKRIFDKAGARLLGFGALAVLLLAQVADPAPMQRLRLLAFDSLQTLSPRPVDAAAQTVVIDVDEESIARIGQWPWPRTQLAKLTDRLGAAGTDAIAYDIVFSEADRTSPEQIAARLNADEQSPALSAQLAALPSHDAVLAQSFTKAPVVTAFFLTKEERGRAVEPKASFTMHGSLPDAKVAQYEGSLQALPPLENAASGNGFVSLQSDDDGIVRRVPLVAIHRGTLIPSLSMEALRVARDAGSPNLLTSDGSGETLASPGAAVAVRLDDLEIPVNEAGEAWVHFPQSSQRTTVPAWKILSDDANAAELREAVSGKIAYVGGSAIGLQDLIATPRDGSIAGVTVHAAMTEQMLSGHFLQRPDWALVAEVFLVLLLGGIFAWLLPKLGAVKGAMFALAGIAGVAALSYFAFTSLQYLIDPVYPMLALVLVYTLQTVATFYREEQQRSHIHAAFDRFLSPELVREIANDPSRLELGGEERDMSVMMCDVRGFSRISEQYSPSQVIQFLIEFLTPMSDILLKNRATLDKYIGDAILAFWNAPLDDAEHHRNSARSALLMTQRLRELNQTKPDEADATWPGEVKVGIGLNSGTCCVGNMGSKQRLDYSIIGDTVNVAARLEGLTKQYGVQIIAGADLARNLNGFALFELDMVRVVGRGAAESIYLLLGDEEMASAPAFTRLQSAHETVLTHYRAMRWDEALKALAANAEAYADMGVQALHALFVERIEAMHSSPPESNWDGVFEAQAK
ncbi:MAG: adenylate/guanylate cyclase domain-containing protein [Marinomonas sp.]